MVIGDLNNEFSTFFINCSTWFRELTRESLNELGITSGQYKLLHIIKKSQPCRMSELSDNIHVSCGSATVMVNKLVEMGLTERMDSPKDRRVIYIKLTKAGESLIDEHKRIFNEILKRRLTKLTEEEQKILLDNVRELNHLLEKFL
ncbi:MarR family winged helix-turn-helix transcriptional regulator [Calorimonas adulescens]|uniref:MarR family transcriptional regulator n=1 Tax=Calorimonas adulescens TaxID=2606906 RepID=A0A5D8QAG1_9THEO|nr:MarR family transcriptional regulator [Calorimonas adulescens]TZE81745.1 MarR family transcriptional regulator [Calorimonas adulescens]